MTVSVFVGTSVDGFIARPNGALDFLPEGGGEPHGYTEFIASVDAIVIGRGGVVERMAGTPAEIVSQLAASGAHHLPIGGGLPIQSFLRAGVIHRLIITRVPVLIGDGIP